MDSPQKPGFYKNIGFCNEVSRKKPGFYICGMDSPKKPGFYKNVGFCN